MPALDAFVTAWAGSDMDVELAMKCLAYDFRLVLLLDFRFLDLAATVGTGIGQRRFENFVDRFGRLAMGFDAIVLTRLAARFLRRPFRRPLRERRRLTLAGPNRFFQLVREPCHLRFQLSDPTLELDNPLVAFKTSLATNGVHARMLAPQLNCSCASLQKNRSWQRGRRYSNT